jgi:catechol 2,3-dioxygenase-like lactoylglutathione lyase family enzyme
MTHHPQHRRDGMAKINKVGHVVLNVSDLDTSLAFYTAALGMEVMAHNTERHMAFLS